MTQTIAELEPLIIDWAKEKGLILHTKKQALKQHGKTEEEVGELLEAVKNLEAAIVKKCESGMWAHRDLQHKVRLEAGDVLVTLVIQSALGEWTLDDCLFPSLYWVQRKGCAFQYWTNGIKIAIEDDDLEWVKSGIDNLVSLLEDTISHYELTIDECLDAAWLKIRDRKGETIDDVFVKAEDLPAQ
jgi:NTP pyrophosphatase (non-canonical NTP hydrolase)